MTQEEQIRLYRLMEKLNWFFHHGPGYGRKDRTGVLSGDPGVYIRHFME